MKGKFISDRILESCGKELTIKQNLIDFDDIEHGGSVWDAAIVLAKYFENKSVFRTNYFADKKILELGSGNGYIGIVLCLLKVKKITMTEKKNLLPLIEENVKINNFENLIGKNIFIKEVDWGKTKIEEKFDIIIASDCIYDKEEM